MEGLARSAKRPAHMHTGNDRSLVNTDGHVVIVRVAGGYGQVHSETGHCTVMCVAVAAHVVLKKVRATSSAGAPPPHVNLRGRKARKV